MTTTVEQKVSILMRWAEHRRERGMDYNVEDQIRFNWPSLDKSQRREILEALEERSINMAKKAKAAKRTIGSVVKKNAKDPNEGKHPSSPSRNSKYNIHVQLGHRNYIERFVDKKMARQFIADILGDEAIRWKNEELLTAKGGVLIMHCNELEELLEMDPPGIELPEPMPRQIEAFLRGKWPAEGDKKKETVKVEDIKKQAAERKSISNGGGTTVTLQDLCEELDLEPRKVRMAMRKAKWDKPEGGWSWPVKQKGEVMKKLKGLFHRD